VKKLIIGIVLLAVLGVGVYGIYTTRFAPVPPKPYQEVADALAEYGWEVIDIEVNTIKRTIRIAAIPPEDDEGYANGFYYILEWADKIIKPPHSDGKPIRGMFPGVLVIGELTVDGPRVLLANGKIAQSYGLARVITLTWEASQLFLADNAEGTPWREVFVTPAKIRLGVTQLSWFGIAYYAAYPTPEAYEVMEDGWYPAPEKPKASEEKS